MKKTLSAFFTVLVFGALLPPLLLGQREGEDVIPPGEDSGRTESRGSGGAREDEPAPLPDLSISRLEAEPESPALGAPLEIEARVRNDGPQALDGVVVRFFIGRRQVGEGGLRIIRAGSTATVKVRTEAAPEGRQRISAKVDPENGVHERNERNNESSRTIEIRPAPGREGVVGGGDPSAEEPVAGAARGRTFERRPERTAEPGETDLVVKEISVARGKATVGVPVEIAANILNAGPVPAERVRIRVMAETKQVGRDQFKTIMPRGRAQVKASWKPARTGHHAIFVHADPEGKVPDDNRENNVRELIVEVFPPSGREEPVVKGRIGTALRGAQVGRLGEERVKADLPLKKALRIGEGSPMQMLMGGGPSIAVTAPMKNSVWPQESKHQITWTQMAGSAGPAYSIKLLQGGKAHSTIVQNKTFTTYLHPWKVPSTLPDGTYQIRVADAKDTTVMGTSAPFTIGKAPPLLVVEPKLLALGTITVTSPSKGDVWWGPNTITWTRSGQMAGSVNIKLIRPEAKPQIFKFPKDGKGISPPVPNTGSYSWNAAPKSLLPCGQGLHIIRVETVDGKVKGDSGVFTIGGDSAGLAISDPSDGHSWTPLKEYTISWNVKGGTCKNEVDIRLIPQVTLNIGGKKSTYFEPLLSTWVAKSFATPKNSYDFKVPGYMQDGTYKLLVESYDSSYLKDSKTIKIKGGYQVPGGTAFLSPEKPDLAVVGLKRKTADKVALLVTNKGASYDGKVSLAWSTDVMDTWATKGSVKNYGNPEVLYFPIKANETKELRSFSTPTAMGSYFKPESPPWSIQGRVFPNDATDANEADNYFQSYLCIGEGSDIALENHINLLLGDKNNWWHVAKGTSKTFYSNDPTWISKDTFEATISMRLYNYGCTSKIAECTLYVDQQKGQSLGKVYVRTGEMVRLEKKVQIKVPDKYKTHQLVFIADQSEKSKESYPNSYMNNFVNAYFKILDSGGAVKGTFDPDW